MSLTSFTDTAAFQAAFDEQVATDNKFIVIFTGSIDEVTNESWCPDCVVAKPHIQRIIDAAGEKVILKGIAARNEWMGNQEHPFRKAPFGANGVPTVVLFEGSNALHKVDDLDSFADNDLMDMLLDD